MDTKLFDDWNVQLAKTYTKGMIEPDTWFTITQKINGVRATSYGDNLVSRTGHAILGCNDILNDLLELERTLGKRYCFDGELRLKPLYCGNMNDNEVFKMSVGIVNAQRDLSQKYKLQFIIFDIIPLKQFAFEQPTDLYKERLRLLKELERIIKSLCLSSLTVVPIFYEGTDISMIETYATKAAGAGMEGIMINLNSRYQYKRTGELLKYKKFNTIDLRVIGVTEGTGKYEGTLGALVCKYKDNLVSVGSGFTDAQRDNIWANLEKVVDTIIEVKYKDITSDQSTGLESLQFPVFLGFRSKIDKITEDA